MGMFDDLVPRQAAPAAGMFDDLIPKSPAPAPQQATGMFDDLVPKATPAAAPAPGIMDTVKGIANQIGSAGVEGSVKEAANEGRNALPGIAMDMVRGILGLPQKAIEASQQDVATMGSGAPKETVGPAAEAAMLTMPMRKTVGGVRAHPTDAMAAPRMEPAVADPSVSPKTPHPADIPGTPEWHEVNDLMAGKGGKYDPMADPTHPDYMPSPDDYQAVGTFTEHTPGPEVNFKAKDILEKTPESVSGPDPLAHPEPSPEQLTGARKAARVVQNILNPDEVSAMAQSAAADIRQAGGRAARDTETTRAVLDAESQKISRLDDNEKLRLIDYIETRSKEGTAPLRADLMPVADAVKQSMDLRRAKIEKLDSAEKAQFVQDYYTHLWKDPDAAARTFSGGPAKEGSGRFLKERSVPTVAEGIARGLEPVSLNPLEVTMRYVQAMDRFIATKQVLDKGLKEGTLKHYTPGEQPPGWVEVNTRKAGGPVYAPEDWARVYNNFVDRGIHAWSEDLGAVYDAARKSSNAVTALELGISGFHMSTMAQEALVNGVAKAIGELASGKPISAVKSAVLTPFTPVTNVVRGRTLEHVYLGKAQGTPLMREITDLLTEAGGRAKGMKHAPEYEYSAGGSYWDSFKHGTALMEAKALGREFAAEPVKTAALYPFRQVGRILQTFAKPLFEYTIPKLKNGAFYDNMASWMEANPNATRPEQLKAARKIWDSIDNRFGETVQDNIFWNKTLKQALQLSLRSYSWTFGTIQEIGGGMKDLARRPTSISPKSEHYSPKAAYVIALPIVYGTLNAVYQKIKTGKDPESVGDLMRGGMTGGIAPGVGGRGEVKERAMIDRKSVV